MTKAVSWRLLGVVLLAAITYAVTQSFVTTTVITVLHHLSFVFIYYFHDRLWEGKEVRGKPFIKTFTYEIVLGFLVLGSISLVFTGSWTQVTNITLLYLPCRLIGYPIHEWLYDRCY